MYKKEYITHKKGRVAKKEHIIKWLKENKKGQFAINDELFRLARIQKRIEEKAKSKGIENPSSDKKE